MAVDRLLFCFSNEPAHVEDQDGNYGRYMYFLYSHQGLSSTEWIQLDL